MISKRAIARMLWTTVLLYSTLAWRVQGSTPVAKPDVSATRPDISAIIGHDYIAEDVTMIRLSIEEALTDYRKDFGSFPSGDNRSIMRCLFGLNSKQKVYDFVDGRYLFDERGNLLDPWLEPYHFTFHGRKARVSSATCDYYDAHPSTNQFPGNADYPDSSQYPTPPLLTKERHFHSRAYKLALCIRLAAQRRHELPPKKHLAQWLVIPIDKAWCKFVGDNWPFQTLAEARRAMIDPWSSPYTIKRSTGSVQVSSAHSFYVASELLQ